jgi:hypothetical protein
MTDIITNSIDEEERFQWIRRHVTDYEERFYPIFREYLEKAYRKKSLWEKILSRLGMAEYIDRLPKEHLPADLILPLLYSIRGGSSVVFASTSDDELNPYLVIDVFLH